MQIRHLFSGGLALAALLVLVLGASAPVVHLADGPAENHLTITASDLALTKVGQPVVRPGGEISYQLTITNTGAQAATNVIVQDVLPPNTTYVSGGTLAGDRVEWTIPNLAGYGGVAEKTLVLAANGDVGTTILNDTYSAWAYSGQAVDGTWAATTRIVDDWAWITPWETYTLTYGGPDVTTAITLPAGTVSEPMTWAYEELDQALHPLALRTRTFFRSFRLTAFRAGLAAPDIRPTDSFSVVLTLPSFVTGQAAVDGRLQLYRWDEGQWKSDGIHCLNEPAYNRVACSVAPQELGEFVLTESQYNVYLPVVFGYKHG
jgi:uncharacterized repeat protein (TIGR01451 family)